MKFRKNGWLCFSEFLTTIKTIKKSGYFNELVASISNPFVVEHSIVGKSWGKA